jgi:hypothetical protein
MGDLVREKLVFVRIISFGLTSPIKAAVLLNIPGLPPEAQFLNIRGASSHETGHRKWVL